MEGTELFSPDVLTAPTKTAAITGATFFNKEVEYAEVDGRAIFEGDIVLSPQQLMSRDLSIAYDSVIVGDRYRWPNAVVPYRLDPGLSQEIKDQVAAAIAHWHANSCVRFVERTTEPDYVNIVPADGCWSYVGRQGGRQDLGLAGGYPVGSVVHELGHALGLWHAHSREDRNDHISVSYSHISGDGVHNFNQHITDGDDVGPYPYSSIMHYGASGFSKDGEDTIVSPCPIGQRRCLDVSNIATVSALYGYPANGGQAELYTVGDKAKLSRLAAHDGWRQTWWMIVPGDFGGSNFSDLLFYEALRGVGCFYLTDGKGRIRYQRYYSNWRTTWSEIVPGDFGGHGKTDLLFYDPTKGQAEFYTTDGKGGLELLRSHSGWRKTWTHIIPGKFSDGAFTDLLFYDGVKGEGEIYATTADGLQRLKTSAGWRKHWAQIVPGNFTGSGYTDLLFYDWRKGEGEFYASDGKGGFDFVAKKTGWRKTWSHIVPGKFGGSGYTDLLFYDPSAGCGEFYAPDGKGNIGLLAQYNGWRKTWAHLVPGQFSGSDRTDLLFYQGSKPA